MPEPEEGMLKGATKEEVAKVCKDNKCIHNLVKLAQSDFEKQVTIEIVNMEANIREAFSRIKVELKYLKWLIVTVLATVIISKLIGV